MQRQNRLRNLRQQRGLSWVELGIKANVHPVTVLCIERWDYLPDTVDRQSLAQVLQVGVDDIWPDWMCIGPAMSKSECPFYDPRLIAVTLLNARQVAALLNLDSGGLVWVMSDARELPRPIRIGEFYRWRLSDLHAFIDGRKPV